MKKNMGQAQAQFLADCSGRIAHSLYCCLYLFWQIKRSTDFPRQMTDAEYITRVARFFFEVMATNTGEKQPNFYLLHVVQRKPVIQKFAQKASKAPKPKGANVCHKSPNWRFFAQCT